MKVTYGLNDFSKKRKKPIYYIISDFSGQIIEDYPAGDSDDWDGGFINYTGKYVLLIKIDSFNNILNEGIFSRIDKKILNDLQQNKVKVCLFLEEGGAQDSVLNKVPFELLQEELLKFNIDESNIVYTDNNLILEEEFKKHCSGSRIKVFSNYFQIWRYLAQQTKIKSSVPSGEEVEMLEGEVGGRCWVIDFKSKRATRVSKSSMAAEVLVLNRCLATGKFPTKLSK